MRLVMLTSLALGLLAGPPAIAAFVNENLITTAPAGYHVAFQNKGDEGLITEWVPAGETAENWTEMVTVQVFYHLKMSPEAFMSRSGSAMAEKLPGRRPGAADRQCGRERLSDAGVAVELPAKSVERQSRDHLVQGGAGHRQFLCRTEGLPLCAVQGANHALGGLSESRARLRLAAARARLSAEQGLSRTNLNHRHPPPPFT